MGVVPQWRSRLARRTYKQYCMRNAKVGSSILPWGNAFFSLLQLYFFEVRLSKSNRTDTVHSRLNTPRNQKHSELVYGHSEYAALPSAENKYFLFAFLETQCEFMLCHACADRHTPFWKVKDSIEKLQVSSIQVCEWCLLLRC